MHKLLLSTLLIAAPLTGCGQNLSWSALKQTIRTTYPDVAVITTDSLASWLAQADSAPLLLDVRTEAEYTVSHLHDARRLDPDTTDFALLDDLDPATPIVTYCSVGYRSAEMARQLHARGFIKVVNLEGSIFEWANEGRPVYRDGRVVHQVHPYDAVWGRLLKKELHAYLPVP